MDLHQTSINIDRVSESITAKTEKALIGEYKSALKNMRSELDTIYAKYAKNGVLSYSEMSKYNRLQGLMGELNDQYKTTLNKTKNLVNSNSKKVFEQGYYQTAYALEMATGSKLSFTKLNPKTIQASIENPIAGLTLNENLNANRVRVVSSIKSNITQGLMQGESYHKVAQRISGILEKDLNKATTIVRTEAHRNSQQGSLAATEHAAKKGIDVKKEWIATLDGRTRDSHQGMDGVIVEWDEDFFIPETGARGPAPGMTGVAAEDINCRCVLGKVVKGAGETTARQTYKEWMHEHSNAVPSATDQPVIAKEAIRQISRDKKDYQNIELEELKEMTKENLVQFDDFEKEGLMNYTRYPAANSPLRQGVPIEKMTEVQRLEIEKMDMAFEKTLPLKNDIIAYRGGHTKALGLEDRDLRAMPQSELEKRFTGKAIVDNGFMSTSTSESVAKDFSEGVFFNILTPKGSRVIPVDGNSAYPGEREILFPRGSTFEIINIQRGYPNVIVDIIFRGV